MSNQGHSESCWPITWIGRAPCGPDKPFFMEWGRQLTEGVAGGKRWGFEIPLPK